MDRIRLVDSLEVYLQGKNVLFAQHFQNAMIFILISLLNHSNFIAKGDYARNCIEYLALIL